MVKNEFQIYILVRHELAHSPTWFFLFCICIKKIFFGTKGEKTRLRYSSTPPYFTYSACTPLVLHLYSTRTPLYSAVLCCTPLYSAVLRCTSLYSAILRCTPLVLHPYSGVPESRLFPLVWYTLVISDRNDSAHN